MYSSKIFYFMTINTNTQAWYPNKSAALYYNLLQPSQNSKHGGQSDLVRHVSYILCLDPP
jgi:hypothetical protein